MQIVDVEKMKKAQTVDVHKPPLITVPDEFWPRLLYKHPKEHYRTVTDRPSNAPATERLVPNEAKVLKVANEKELKKALTQGWREQAFVPRPLEDSDYGIEYEGDEIKQ